MTTRTAHGACPHNCPDTCVAMVQGCADQQICYTVCSKLSWSHNRLSDPSDEPHDNTP